MPEIKPFLLLVAEDLLARFPGRLQQCCIVTPHRRPQLFLSRHLAQLCGQPVWAPHFTTITELMAGMSGLVQADLQQLLFTLYQAYQAVRQSDETFDKFYHWGELLLGDFDDIDRYLVPAADLFRNMLELQDIDQQFAYLTPEQIHVIRQFWQSFLPASQRKNQSDFLATWQLLNDVYGAFRQTLKAQGIGYEGMLYREVAESIQAETFNPETGITYIFCGFNALSRCEEILFGALKRSGAALFYWDYDDFYVKNPDAEAGFFIRRNLSNFPQALLEDTFSNFKPAEKRIDVLALPSGVGQGKIVGKALSAMGITTAAQLERTAVVLADEHLLLPVLHGLPEKITDCNVTMGYPVHASPTAGLVDRLFKLAASAQQLSQQDEPKFYFRDVLSILKHQCMTAAYPEDARRMAAAILSDNRFSIDAASLAANPLFGKIFKRPPNALAFADYLLDVLQELSHRLFPQHADDDSSRMVEQEVLFAIFLEIRKLREIIGKIDAELQIETFQRILRMALRRAAVPFEGEPLAGIQVIGLLETRALDFDNVIVLSMNEGVIPKGRSAMSCIPYNLRRGFGLPTFEHRDAISAYCFYRLLQRAGKITLAYNSVSGKGLNTSEKSRFLLQLLHEPGLTITEKSQTFSLSQQPAPAITIEKNDAVLQSLARYVEGVPAAAGQRYISPSALVSFIECPLRFYFSYVAGLSEIDEVTEEVDSALFGDLLHYAMEKLYTPFMQQGRQVTESMLEGLLRDCACMESALGEAFVKKIFKTDAVFCKENLHGRNIIIYEVIKKYLLAILNRDKIYAPFTVVQLERKYLSSVPLIIEGREIKIRVGGKIDRVDKITADGKASVRIIDYKSGVKKTGAVPLEDLFRPPVGRNYSHTLQALMYAWLYLNNEQETLPVAPGIYNLRELYSDTFDWRSYLSRKIIQEKDGKEKKIKEPINDFSKIRDDFHALLCDSLKKIFDPSEPFIQTKDEKKCGYCAYKAICLRG